MVAEDAESKRHIFLTGFMGAGKTTVGQALAERLGWEFVDLDRAIEKRVGLSIPEIFAQQGEDIFRHEETRSLQLLDDGPGKVVATGGGIVGREENRRLLSRLGKVVFLDLPWHVLQPRLQAQGGRPLATGAQGWEPVRRLYEMRQPYYRQADLRIECSGLSPWQIVTRIVEMLNLCPEDPA